MSVTFGLLRKYGGIDWSAEIMPEFKGTNQNENDSGLIATLGHGAADFLILVLHIL